MPPLTNVEIAQQLPGVVAEIQKILSATGSYHGVLRGSMEAALAESQGAEIIGPDGQPFNHLQNLKDTLNALTNNRDTLRSFLAQIRASGDYSSVSKLSESLQPMMQAAADKQAVMAETVELAESLENRKSRSIHRRGLRSRRLGGRQTGRTVASLVSEQLKVLAGVLRQRGIDPTLLPRSVSASANVLMEEIEEQPVAAETAFPGPSRRCCGRQPHTDLRVPREGWSRRFRWVLEGGRGCSRSDVGDKRPAYLRPDYHPRRGRPDLGTPRPNTGA